MVESLGSFEGKYERLERIGEGGMGAVYKVRHRLLDDIRVIKTMRANVANRDQVRERFFREAKIAARVRHENIAQVFDFAMDENTAFLVMEYIDGVTLKDILATLGPPSLPLALEIAQQSLRALAIVHKAGIIHRDVSPDNLMLTVDSGSNPKIKLIDLGLAKITEEETAFTQEGFFLGKVRYAAPEQFRADQNLAMGSWSDVYSFGLVFYELLTGRFPIRGGDGPGLLAGHLTHAPLSFEDSDPDGRIPDELRQIVLTSLEKLPADRFPDGEAYHDRVRLLQMEFPLAPEHQQEAARLTRETSRPRPSDDDGPAALGPPLPARAAEPPRPPSPPTVVRDHAPAKAAVTSARVTRDARAKRRIAAAALVAVLAAAAIALVTGTDVGLRSLLRGDKAPAGDAAVTGTLVLDARPWAEVLGISTDAGDPVPLEGSRVTPLVLSLAAGLYDISLRNDTYGQRDLRVEIVPGKTTAETVTLGSIDEERLLRSLGVIE